VGQSAVERRWIDFAAELKRLLACCSRTSRSFAFAEQAVCNQKEACSAEHASFVTPMIRDGSGLPTSDPSRRPDRNHVVIVPLLNVTCDAGITKCGTHSNSLLTDRNVPAGAVVEIQSRCRRFRLGGSRFVRGAVLGADNRRGENIV